MLFLAIYHHYLQLNQINKIQTEIQIALRKTHMEVEERDVWPL